MLKELCIENIAVIEYADILFTGGLNVLSGETGAGKSIIIDSINAILGARVSRELIRTGETRASVTALFCDLSESAGAYARELGFEAEEESLLIMREIFSDGRNNCRINGKPATLSIFRLLSEKLISIQGQHDGRHLLDEALHIDYLDNFLHLEPHLAAYKEKYQALLAINRRIKAISESTSERERRREILEYQLSELHGADIKPGEEAQLASLKTELINAEKTAQAMEDAKTALSGEGQSGALELLSVAENTLAKAGGKSPKCDALANRAKEIYVLATEFLRDIANERADMDFSPETLEQTEERLDLIRKLMKKHAVSADELCEVAENLSIELNSIDSSEGDLSELKEEYIRLRREVAAQAETIHQKREKGALQLKQLVEQELAELDMPQTHFFAEVTDLSGGAQTKFTKKGTDNVRFTLSANIGEEPKALSKVASGGELSRIMLALKSFMHEPDVTSIYDEVDAGVSGRAANKVAEKLYFASTDRQTLCVTHLPQIAAFADSQYFISKEARDGRTYTKVETLSFDGRVHELARLIAGIHVTQTALNAAKDMLMQAQTRKNMLNRGDSRDVI